VITIAAQMKTQTLGTSSLRCTRLAYGAWRLVSTMNPAEVTAEREEQGRRAVVAAYEAGYTLFDHADIYCRGVCEKVFGDAMRDVPGMRDRILIATKCGIRFAGEPNPDSPHRFDFSAGHIIRSCEGSLKRLGVETIDLYQLHRPDALMNPEEVAGAFDQLKDQGKVREFGVSNFLPSTVAALQRSCPMKLIVNQIEIHPGRIDPFYDGTLDQCLAERMTPIAWSPLGGGLFGESGEAGDADPRREGLTKLLTVLDDTAKRYGVTRSVVTLAWLMKHPAGVLPIVGSINPQRIRDSLKADGIDMDREDWYRIFVAARMAPLP
jgi:predicted oxidoreductase